MARSELGHRLLVAAVGIPLGILVVYVGGWVLMAVLGLLAFAGTFELYRLAANRGWRPFGWMGAPASLLLVGWAQWTGSFTAWAPGAMGILLVLALGALGAAVVRRGPNGDPLVASAVTVVGVLYAGAPLAFGLFLRGMGGSSAPSGASSGAWAGALVLIFPLVVTWLADTAAYFTGSRVGRRKLIPSVSPGKTVEGSIGGLAAAVAGAVAYASFLLDPQASVHLAPFAAAAAGLLIGVVAQIGDLAESLLKREAGVKDSGTLLPGHGGILDRFDGVYFTLPLTWAILIGFA